MCEKVIRQIDEDELIQILTEHDGIGEDSSDLVFDYKECKCDILRRTLLNFGKHKEDCAIHKHQGFIVVDKDGKGDPCDCGYHDALRKIDE